MAGYRQIHTQIWKDEWFIELDADEKLLWIYLFSNDLASISGLYKIPIRVIVNETGLAPEYVKNTLASFEASHKIFYEDGVMWVVNMTKYHKNPSEHTQKKVQADIDLVPDGNVKRLYQYHQSNPGYPIDTLSARYEHHALKEKEKEKTKEKAEGGQPPATPPPSNPPRITEDAVSFMAFQKVTGMNAYPGKDAELIRGALNGLRLQYPTVELLADYLKPFYEEWKRRGYSKTNCAWLYDWAVAGEIPPESKQSKPGKPRSAAEEGWLPA